MSTYNFITLDNGGVSALVDGKYQNTFFNVVSANYVNGNLIIIDSLGFKFSFNIDNSFEIAGVAVVGSTTVKCEAVVAILPTTSGGTLTEADPVFTASAAHSITLTNTSNWNTAYGWGNHASAGYLTSSLAASTYQPIGSYLTSITSGNVTTALGFTPYNSTNPANYLTSTLAASTYQPIGSYLTSITSGNVTTALGFTPYNSTNPSGYISSYTETDPIYVANGVAKAGTQTITGAKTFSGGVTMSNHLLFSLDNTYDIGANGATRPASIYFGNTLYVGNVATPATLFSGGNNRLSISGFTNFTNGIYLRSTLNFGSSDYASEASISRISSGLLGITSSLQVTTSVSIGTGATPASKLHLAAGTSTVNTAPLQLTSGISETTPRAGLSQYSSSSASGIQTISGSRFTLTESDTIERFIVQSPTSVKTTAGAPLVNDGYITVMINGTSLKLMTTA